MNMTQRGCRKAPYGNGAFQEVLTGGNHIKRWQPPETQGVSHGKRPTINNKDNPERILDLPLWQDQNSCLFMISADN